ncbi:MAG: dTMP kinase [Bdellovibrio sp.]|nr:dTMP kinase [Bdellovibrio sp.]
MEHVPQELLQSFRPPAFHHSYFISFEGIEGSGKTTQIRLTKEFLEERNFRVLILREPGGTTFGEHLRQAVLSTTTQLHPLAEAYLFAASRAQLLHEVVMKELSIPNTVVICDRYLDSTLVYQGKARNLGHRLILEIHQHFPLNLTPHITFFLEIGLDTSRDRQRQRNSPKDYFEGQGEAFYRKLIEGYQEVRELFPDRICTLNGELVPDEVFALIQERLNALLKSDPSVEKDGKRS